MNHTEKVGLLQSIPLFQDLGPGELEEISVSLVDRAYPPNRTVIEEGQVGEAPAALLPEQVIVDPPLDA